MTEYDRNALSPWARTLAHASARKRLDAILKERDADQTIASMSELEAYYLVKELGIDEAVPVLAVLAPQQIRAIFDLDVWKKDRVELPDLITWLAAFADMSTEKLYEAVNAIDFELLGLLIHRRLLVCSAKLPEEEIPGWVHNLDGVNQSPDGRFFYAARTRDSEDEEDEDAAELDEEERKALVYILDRLYRAEDWELAARALRLAETDLASSLEEDALRFRNARLEDLGFPPIERAIEAYGPLQPESVAEPARSDIEETRLPALHAEELAKGQILSEALSHIEDEAIVHRIESELVPLANAILVADRTMPGDLEGVTRALARIQGNITMGACFGSTPGERIPFAARNLERHSIRDLFRVGHTLTLRLAERARRLVASKAFARGNDAKALLPDGARTVIDSLLLQRPIAAAELFGEAGMSRPFANLEELERATAYLEGLEALGALIGGVALPLAEGVLPPAPEWTAETILNTRVANTLLGREPDASPVPARDLTRLVGAQNDLEPARAIWAAGPANAEAVLRRCWAQASEELVEQVGPQTVTTFLVTP